MTDRPSGHRTINVARKLPIIRPSKIPAVGKRKAGNGHSKNNCGAGLPRPALPFNGAIEKADSHAYVLLKIRAMSPLR